MKDRRSVPPSICLPSSGSSAMERSSSSAAIGLMIEPAGAHERFVHGRRDRYAFSSRAVRTASMRPSAAKNFSVRGSRSLR